MPPDRMIDGRIMAGKSGGAPPQPKPKACQKVAGG